MHKRFESPYIYIGNTMFTREDDYKNYIMQTEDVYTPYETSKEIYRRLEIIGKVDDVAYCIFRYIMTQKELLRRVVFITNGFYRKNRIWFCEDLEEFWVESYDRNSQYHLRNMYSTQRDGGLPAMITFLYNLDMYEPIFLQLPCYEYYAELDEYEENEENEEEE